VVAVLVSMMEENSSARMMFIPSFVKVHHFVQMLQERYYLPVQNIESGIKKGFDTYDMSSYGEI
jgi:hypothetical protein